MKDDQLIEILWSICLSDHLGDVEEAIAPILKHFAITKSGLENIREEMKDRGIIPEWAKD